MYTLQILTHIQNSRQVFDFLNFQAQLMDMLGKILQEITICLSSLKKISLIWELGHRKFTGIITWYFFQYFLYHLCF